MKNSANTPPTPSSRADEYGELQRLVDALFAVNPSKAVPRLDVIVLAETLDLCDDLIDVVEHLPSGSYKRYRLCDQLNSIITARGLGFVYGTVE